MNTKLLSCKRLHFLYCFLEEYWSCLCKQFGFRCVHDCNVSATTFVSMTLMLYFPCCCSKGLRTIYGGCVQVALFCLCMGGIMYYHEYEPDTMAPFLRGLITRFLNRTGTPVLPPALSYPYVSTSSDNLYQIANSPQILTESPRVGAPGLSHKKTGTPPADSTIPAQKDKSQPDSGKVAEKLNAEAFQGL